MKTWKVELITDYVTCNQLEIDALVIRKDDFQTLVVDGVKWEVPEVLGMSFGEFELISK